jgi:hypothetical protein
VTGREAPGLIELREIVRQFQRSDPHGARLVLRCHPLVAQLLRTGAPDLVPAPGTEAGSGEITRRLEVEIRHDWDEGFWALLEGGEQITAGTVGPAGTAEEGAG